MNKKRGVNHGGKFIDLDDLEEVSEKYQYRGVSRYKSLKRINSFDDIVEDSLIMKSKINIVLKTEKDEFKRILLKDAREDFGRTVDDAFKDKYGDIWEKELYKHLDKVQIK